MNLTRSFRAALASLGLALLAGTAGAQPAALVRDLESREAPVKVSQIVPVPGKTFFVAERGSMQRPELWVSDGTPDGTRVLVEGCPDSCLSPRILGTLGNVVLWRAENGLWRSDGTPDGTFRLDDPADGFTFSAPALFVRGVYVAYACTPESCALWRTDGTLEGTVPLQSFKRRARPAGHSRSVQAAAISESSLGFFVDSSSIVVTDGTAAGTREIASFSTPTVRGMAQVGDRIFFFAAEDEGDELWTSDGTETGTHALTHFSAPRPFGGQETLLALQASGRHAYFSVVTGEEKGLWRSDGTAAGTRRIAGIVWKNRGNSFEEGPHFAAEVVRGTAVLRSNSRLWTSAGDPATAAPLLCGNGPCPRPAPGRSLARFGKRAVFLTAQGEIWGTDGTEKRTFRLASCRTSECPQEQELLSWPQGIAFLAWDEVHGVEIWSTDGTPGGTRRLTDLPGLDFRLNPGEKVPVAGTDGQRIVFRAPAAGVQALWTADAVGTRLLTTLPASASSFPRSFQPLPGGLVFSACAGGKQDVWFSSGTAAGTIALTAGAAPCDDTKLALTSAAGFVFFQQEGDLWRTDGTLAGTARLTFDQNVPEEPMAELHGALYLFKETPNGRALWRSDGTVAGTVEVFPAPIGGWSEIVTSLGSAGGFLWFIRTSVGPDFHQELWRSDGTPAGMVRIDSPHTVFPPVVAMGSQIFFLGSGLDGEIRVWRADGSAGGSYPLNDVDASHFTELKVIGDALYFVAGTPEEPLDLYRSDGTPQGTVSLLRILVPEGTGGIFSSVTEAAGHIFFSAGDGVHGIELWSTDGTAAGTRMVRDIAPGGDSSRPASLAAAGGLLYFAADDAVHGVELWQSDGTAEGTRLAVDIAPGNESSVPANLIAAAGRLWMSADDGSTGRELWALPLPQARAGRKRTTPNPRAKIE